MPLGGVIFIAAFIAVFGVILIYLARAIGGVAKRTSKAKMEIYECGIEEIEKKDTKISVKLSNSNPIYFIRHRNYFYVPMGR